MNACDKKIKDVESDMYRGHYSCRYYEHGDDTVVYIRNSLPDTIRKYVGWGVGTHVREEMNDSIS